MIPVPPTEHHFAAEDRLTRFPLAYLGESLTTPAVCTFWPARQRLNPNTLADGCHRQDDSVFLAVARSPDTAAVLFPMGVDRSQQILHSFCLGGNLSQLMRRSLSFYNAPTIHHAAPKTVAPSEGNPLEKLPRSVERRSFRNAPRRQRWSLLHCHSSHSNRWVIKYSNDRYFG